MRNLTKISFYLLAAVVLAGCTAKHYRKSADKEVYKIVQQKQKAALGQTNEFTIDTPYSHRKPEDIKSSEIIIDRMREEKQTLTLPEALRIAFERSREYQNRKERLYLSALALTQVRFAYVPQLFAGTAVTGERAANGEESFGVGSRAGFTQLFKTGGRLTLNLANDLLRFYAGGRTEEAVTTIGLTLSQPLLRGAGARIAAENLTQAERNVIYEIRDFSFYQDSFAMDIVIRYLRLLQQQDTVKNEYNNFLSSVGLRERAVALSVDRLAPFQADQAVQEELSARNTYILAVENHRTALDLFKLLLGLPASIEVQLDENALAELEKIGLLPLPLTDKDGFLLALEKRPDLQNSIDRFEDSKRKVDVAANNLKADVGLFGNYVLISDAPTDYARFNLNDYRLNGGIELDLPLNRKVQRNQYRESIIDFEVRLRELAERMDNLRTGFRDELRSLAQLRQTYEIENRARELADRRVESSELSLQAGRIQVRDVVDAQNARVRAYNAVTRAMVDYHAARLRLLLNLGILNTAQEKFWLEYGSLPQKSDAATPAAPTISSELVTPDELFKHDNQ